MTQGWRRMDWLGELSDEERQRRQQTALHVTHYYERPIMLALKGGGEVNGFLHAMHLNGPPDPDFPNDPVTVELRNHAPVALDRIVGVLPGRSVDG